MVRRWSSAVLALCLLGAACGDDGPRSDGGAPDSSADARADGGDSGAEVAEPAPPRAAALPELTPCPAGWREAALHDDVTICDPWPEEGPATCDDDAAHFPGEATCSRVGSPCPAGDFPEDLPPDRPVVYVLAGAGGRRDGSVEHPFDSIADALGVAAPGTIVSVGKGRYDERLVIPAEVTIWGACVAETVLSPTDDAESFEGVVEIPNPTVEVRNLTIADTGLLGVVVDEAPASAQLRDVVIRRVSAYGVLSFGGDLAATNLVISETGPYAEGTPREGTRGRGLQPAFGAVFDIERASIRASHDTGLTAFSAEAHLTDVAVIDTVGDTAQTSGYGVDVSAGSRVDATRAVFQNNALVGFRVFGSSSALEDVVIRNTRALSSGANGDGLWITNGSDVTATRLAIIDNVSGGVTAFNDGAGTVISMSDVVVHGTRTTSAGAWGDGMWLTGPGASAETMPLAVNLERVLFSNNGASGLTTEGTTVRVRATDLTIRSPGEAPATSERVGIALTSGGFMDAERLRIERGSGVGILVRGDQASVADGTTGWLSRSEMLMRDVTVSDTSSLPATGTLGRGVQVQFGVLRGERVLLEQNREVALMAFGGRVELRDLSIIDALPADCAESETCPAHGFGHGVYKGPRANVLLERFAIDSAALCGVVVDGEGVLALSEGRVSHSTIGACVFDSDYDIGTLMNGVEYRENGVNLDAPELPTPDYLVAD